MKLFLLTLSLLSLASSQSFGMKRDREKEKSIQNYEKKLCKTNSQPATQLVRPAVDAMRRSQTEVTQRQKNDEQIAGFSELYTTFYQEYTHARKEGGSLPEIFFENIKNCKKTMPPHLLHLHRAFTQLIAKATKIRAPQALETEENLPATLPLDED